METFRALMVEKSDIGFLVGIHRLTEAELPEGELLIRVAYSGMNYKDALACTPDGNIVKRYPFVPGIDLSGTVVRSADSRFREGDAVLATGFGLGVSHYGGFSELARVPADWAVPLPIGLTPREAMTIGTAGFTAGLSVQALLARGVAPDSGPVLVTGATGGVGSMAVAILAKLGYEVAAVTGKRDRHAELLELGAARVMAREDLLPAEPRPLERQQWAGAVDCVGGRMLAHALASTRYGGTVTACGLTGGSELATTVFPFILRGVSLVGIDSVEVPMVERLPVWERLAGEWKPAQLDAMRREIALEDVPDRVRSFLTGASVGRIVVKVQP